MRERTGPHIGRLFLRHTIQDIVQRNRNFAQTGQCLKGDACLKLARVWLFQQQCWNNRSQVGVTTTLAQSVQRALDLAGTSQDSGQRSGDSVLCVVMRVNAKMITRDATCDHGLHDHSDLLGHSAAIGIAKRDPAASSIIGCVHSL